MSPSNSFDGTSTSGGSSAGCHEQNKRRGNAAVQQVCHKEAP